VTDQDRSSDGRSAKRRLRIRHTLKPLLAVFAGGIAGTGLRLAVDVALPPADDAFPLGTLIVNVVGAFALGVLVGRVWTVAPDWLRAGLGAGLLGSFTTFSAIAVSMVALTAAGAGVLALGYLAVTLVGGLAAAALGLGLGRRATPSRIPIGPEE
jgi:CrcB protein